MPETSISADSEPLVTESRLQPPMRSDEAESVINLKHDLGCFIDGTKSVDEILMVVHSMDDSQKYKLLRHHEKPPENFSFPNQYLGGANRSFKLQWIEEHGWWLVYSSKLDGAFCVCCALFASKNER